MILSGQLPESYFASVLFLQLVGYSDLVFGMDLEILLCLHIATLRQIISHKARITSGNKHLTCPQVISI
jgi:hypothetical protein